MGIALVVVLDFLAVDWIQSTTLLFQISFL